MFKIVNLAAAIICFITMVFYGTMELNTNLQIIFGTMTIISLIIGLNQEE